MTGAKALRLALSSFLLFLYHKSSVHCLNNYMMNGDIINDKFVQVYVDSGLVPICWEQSTRNDVGNTVCKQLGLDGARSTEAVRKRSGIPVTRKVIHVKSCGSDASHIFQCDYNISKFENCCIGSKVISVVCDSTEYVYEGQLRLVQGEHSQASKTESTSEGMLRVYLNGKWTSVCDETFGVDAAECSCKQLGYAEHISYDTVHYASSDQNMMMWIGTNSNKGRLNCSSSESDRCLTECYSKPEQTTQCSSNGKVYLKCGYRITTGKNQNTTGSKSLCEFSKKTTASISTAGIGGIVAGSILFAIICLIGVCYGIYFSAKAKKPCVKSDSSDVPESSIKLTYSAVENYDSACTDSEQEDKFDRYHYQPPALLPQHDETN